MEDTGQGRAKCVCFRAMGGVVAALRVLHQPWITVVSLVLATLLVATIPVGRFDRSVIRSALFGNGPRLGGWHPSHRLDVQVIFDGQETHVVGPWEHEQSEEEREWWGRVAEGNAVEVWASFWPSTRSSGLLGFTSRAHVHELNFTEPLTAVQVSAAQAAIQSFVASAPPDRVDPETAAMILDFVGTRTEELASGYVLNGVVIACLAMCVLSLGWIPRELARQKRARRIGRGLCPACSYSNSGLVGGVCPECGEGRPEAQRRENQHGST